MADFYLIFVFRIINIKKYTIDNIPISINNFGYAMGFVVKKFAKPTFSYQI
jgi:hypothetical protein